MPRPDLYRTSIITTQPQFDVVRPGLDIEVVDGIVRPVSGGVSVFAAIGSGWPPDTTFVLPNAASLPPGLVAQHDCGTHWLLQPSREMTLEEFKRELSVLNSQAVHCDPSVVQLKTTPALPDMPINPDRAVRFVYEALVVCARERLAPADDTDWDDNDYAYLRVLSSALHTDEMPLDAVCWKPNVGWTREVEFIARATHAFMKWSIAQADGDDDLGANAFNDNEYLRAILGWGREGNPYAHLMVYPTCSESGDASASESDNSAAS